MSIPFINEMAHMHWSENAPRVPVNEGFPLEWTIFRGMTDVTEDFCDASFALFVCSGHNMFAVECRAERGTIFANIPAIQEEGVYDLRLVWYKRFCEFDRSRALKQHAFIVTRDAQSMNGKSVLRVVSRVASFGYDGLSAYELAVLRGKTMLSLDDWIDQQGVDIKAIADAYIKSLNLKPSGGADDTGGGTGDNTGDNTGGGTGDNTGDNTGGGTGGTTTPTEPDKVYVYTSWVVGNISGIPIVIPAAGGQYTLTCSGTRNRYLVDANGDKKLEAVETKSASIYLQGDCAFAGIKNKVLTVEANTIVSRRTFSVVAEIDGVKNVKECTQEAKTQSVLVTPTGNYDYGAWEIGEITNLTETLECGSLSVILEVECTRKVWAEYSDQSMKLYNTEKSVPTKAIKGGNKDWVSFTANGVFNLSFNNSGADRTFTIVLTKEDETREITYTQKKYVAPDVEVNQFEVYYGSRKDTDLLSVLLVDANKHMVNDGDTIQISTTSADQANSHWIAWKNTESCKIDKWLDVDGDELKLGDDYQTYNTDGYVYSQIQLPNANQLYNNTSKITIKHI